MQNRRIIDRLTSRIGLTVHPAIVSNSLLGVCAHVRQGVWASIVPHSFFHVLGQEQDIVAIDIVDTVPSDSIGIILTQPQSHPPIASALLAVSVDLGLEESLSPT